MYKKILIMCCICISLIVTHSTVFAQDSYSDYYYEALTALGIDTEENSDKYISKGEFCKVVLSLMKLNVNNASDASYFKDVPVEHTYHKEITTLAEHGYILGDDNKRFYPDDSLSLETAHIILVRCLGYETVAQTLGGWVIGYNSIVYDLDISEGIGNVSVSGLTYEQVNRLVFNTLMSATCVMDYSDKTIKEGKILAHELYSAFELEGIVSKNKFTGLNELTGCIDSTVEIDGVSVYVGETSADDYLGHYVRAMLIENDDEYTLVALTNHKNDSSLVINARELEDVPDLYNVEYTPNNSTKTKKIKLDRNASVIYNFQKLEAYTTEDLKIDNGEIEFIDNDDDGTYEVAIINEYLTYVVSGVDTSTGEIYDKYGYKAIDASEDAVILNAYDYKVDISTITQNNVLSVFVPKNTAVDHYTVIRISGNKPIDGSVTAIRRDDKYTIVTINGNEYIVDPRYIAVSTTVNSRFQEITTKTSGAFLINKDGMISGFTPSYKGELYGYLMKMGYDENEEVSYFKIYSQNADFISGDISEKLTINGTRIKHLSELTSESLLFTDNKKVKPQLVRFEINSDGQLASLKVTDKTAISPMLTDDEELTYNGNVSEGEMRPIGNKYAYKYVYDDDTVIFNVPAVSDVNDETLYSISDKIFTDGYKLSLELYDVAFDYIIGAALCVAGANEVQFANQQNLTVIENVHQAYDENSGDIVTAISGILNGAKVTYMCPAGRTYFDGLKKGDLVRVVVDEGTGKISGAAKIFTFEDAGASADTDGIIYHDRFARKMPHTTPMVPAGDRDLGLTTVYGKCIARGNNTLAVTMDSGASAYGNMVAKDARVYVVEYSDRSVNVTETSFEAIVPSSSPTGSEGHNILQNIRNTSTREIFIIKEN